MGGRSSVVEFQPSKLAVVGSNPIARSKSFNHLAHRSLRIRLPCHGFSRGSNENRALCRLCLVSIRPDRRRLAVVGHCFNGVFQVGRERWASPNQAGGAVSQESGNRALSLVAHGQPTGEGKGKVYQVTVPLCVNSTGTQFMKKSSSFSNVFFMFRYYNPTPLGSRSRRSRANLSAPSTRSISPLHVNCRGEPRRRY